MMGWFALVFAF